MAVGLGVDFGVGFGVAVGFGVDVGSDVGSGVGVSSWASGRSPCSNVKVGVGVAGSIIVNLGLLFIVGISAASLRPQAVKNKTQATSIPTFSIFFTVLKSPIYSM